MDFSDGKRSAPVLYKPELDSTNMECKRLATAGAASGTVVVASRQSAGRGRLGRSFASPEGGLYLSMLLRALDPPERNLSLTPGTAVAVCRAVERVCGVSCAIKWPNDLQLGGKKICGILTESFSAAGELWLVLGVGVNVNTRAFPPELEEIAGSLWQLTGRETDMEGFARTLIGELDRMVGGWQRDSATCLAEYRARCVTPGQDVLIWQNGGSRPARAVGIHDDFSLAVLLPDGTREDIRFGEVTLRSIPTK